MTAVPHTVLTWVVYAVLTGVLAAQKVRGVDVTEQHHAYDTISDDNFLVMSPLAKAAPPPPAGSQLQQQHDNNGYTSSAHAAQNGAKTVSTFDSFLPPVTPLETKHSQQNPFDSYIIPQENKLRYDFTAADDDVTSSKMATAHDVSSGGGGGGGGGARHPSTNSGGYLEPNSLLNNRTSGFNNPAYDPYSDYEQIDVSQLDPPNYPPPTPLDGHSNAGGPGFPTTASANSSQQNHYEQVVDKPLITFDVTPLNERKHKEPKNTSTANQNNASKAVFSAADTNNILPPYPTEFTPPAYYAAASQNSSLIGGEVATPPRKEGRRLPRYHVDTTSPDGVVIPVDTNSPFASLQRELLAKTSSMQKRQEKKMAEMRPDEVMDVSLRKEPSPRVTPRSSPYLPHSTPFVAKHNQNLLG